MQSAGILLYRSHHKKTEVLLVHPGGPFWKNKDAGAWTIPKGEIMNGEEPFAAAIREFFEETGIALIGEFKALQPIRQKGGKIVHAWAMEHDMDAAGIKSNSFEMEWPPGSGKKQSFPEVDRAAWFDVEEAAKKSTPHRSPSSTR